MNQKQEALLLAEDVLSDIELSRISPTDIARKLSRLARLLNDDDGLRWLNYEIGGYPPGTLGKYAWEAAGRSNRIVKSVNGQGSAYTGLVGEYAATIDASKAQMLAATDPSISISSANPHQMVYPGPGNVVERRTLRESIKQNQGILDRIMGGFHSYASTQYQKLRFGAAVETIFETIRTGVDANISKLVPEALPKLSTAFENVSTDDPEQWKNAVFACRELIKTTADALRPSGPDVKGIKMGGTQYVNRLANWIENKTSSTTYRKVIKNDLEHLGARLDAVTGAGNKGTHANITKPEASRYVVGTYLLLRDILELGLDDDKSEALPVGDKVIPADEANIRFNNLADILQPQKKDS